MGATYSTLCEKCGQAAPEVGDFGYRVFVDTLLTIKPLLHMSRRDLWQLYMLGK